MIHDTNLEEKPEINLLFKNNNKDQSDIDTLFLKNLHLDKVVRCICADVRLQEKVLRLLANMGTDTEDIEWRHDILKDFIINRELLAKLCEIERYYENIVEEKKRYRRSRLSTAVTLVFEAMQLHEDMSPLFFMRAAADQVLQFLRVYYKIGDAFKGNELASEGLSSMKLQVENTIGKKALEELGNLMISLTGMNLVDTSYILDLDFNEWLDVIAVEIRELGRGVKVNKPGSLPLQLPVKSVNRWVEIGLDGFTHFLEEIAIGIEQYFRQYFDGLYFYVFALHYMDKMNEFEIQVCFPEISPSIGKLFQVNNLIDLWLAFDLYSCDVNPGRGFMTPNNVLLSPHNRLTVVTGSNNSGKTVYLRAIGIAQVFAQAGLPIPADYGKISPVDRIYTHFATGETGISRFEEEVAFVSNILDSYTDQSIVLLNETFQTTGVQEARMILENVLEALGIVGARTILVTHVSGLTASLIKNPEIGNICNALTMEVVDGKPTYRVIDNKKSYI